MFWGMHVLNYCSKFVFFYVFCLYICIYISRMTIVSYDYFSVTTDVQFFLIVLLVVCLQIIYFGDKVIIEDPIERYISSYLTETCAFLVYDDNIHVFVFSWIVHLFTTVSKSIGVKTINYCSADTILSYNQFQNYQILTKM